MLFNSYIFLLLFLPVTLIGFFGANKIGKHNLATAFLIVMSFWFYGYFNISYLFILVGSIIVNWGFSQILLMAKGKMDKVVLGVGVFANIAVIFYFKYYDFFLDNLNHIFKTSFELKNIVLPLGISFFTFQQISFLIDSYRKETKGYRFIEYAAFVAFFPQLIAGPIVLHNEIIPQLRDMNKRKYDHSNFANGLYVLAVGLFKKVLIADTFGIAVSWAWGNVDALSSGEIWIVMLCYTFQIYFDFSGYCDMAIGIGKLFNIELPINFNSPYKSFSIIEFWTRWHITLTRFLRTYIYFPLGGSRKGKIRTYVNIMIVFLISGIWHGANWTFIVWGMLHGLAQVLTRLFKNTWEKCNKVFQWLTTFSFVNIMWLVFRSENLQQAWELLTRAFSMQSLEISSDFYNCFRLEEFSICEMVWPWSRIVWHIQGVYMWLFLVVALFICLNFSNVHEKRFRPTMAKAIGTIIMFVWGIISLSGVSTFLYFNF